MFRSICFFNHGLTEPALSFPPQHISILPVYSELRRPTRERAHNIVHFTMGTTLALYLWVGLMGYAYA